MNTTHVEHDPLAALRAELTMAAGRRIRRRRSQRRTVVIVAVIALLLAATAATAALVKNTTGVPAVDELLDIEVPGAHKPGPGDASRPLPVRMGDGIYETVAYLARDGSVCIARPSGTGVACAEASEGVRHSRTSTGDSSAGERSGSARRMASMSGPTS